MNYYKRHLGDYAKDTGHLSLLEHGVYTLLLDAYYATERPIPADKAHRIAKANTKAERAAADSVLAYFFKLEDGSYRQGRCDREILEAKESEEETKARRDNERERQHRHRERRKELFAALRERGQVPHFDMPTNELETLLSRVTGRDGHAPVTADATAIPLATNHKPLAKETERPRKRGSRLPKPFEIPPEWVREGCRIEAELGSPLGVNMKNEFAKFCDHWWAKSGKDATKEDWLATWRNWIRRACEYAPRGAAVPAPKPVHQCSKCANPSVGWDGFYHCAEHMPKARAAA